VAAQHSGWSDHSGGMIYPTLENSDITTTGIVVLLLALAATIGWRYVLAKRYLINQT